MPYLFYALALMSLVPDPSRAESAPSREHPGFWSRFTTRSLPDRLAAGLDRLDSGAGIIAHGDTLYRKRNKDLSPFYALRNRAPAWFSHGNPVPAAWQLLDALRKCPLEGLEPAHYHALAIDTLLSGFNRKPFWRVRMAPGKAVQLELLLSDAYLKMARHLLYGRVRPKIPEDGWHVGRERVDLPAYLDEALRKKLDLRLTLRSLTPPQEEYGKMKYWLAEYRKLQAAGGWHKIHQGPSLGPKSQGPRVEALCLRLSAEGGPAGGECPDIFTPAVAEALKRFQSSHGLDTTGIADAVTLNQLNVPVEERIRQIERNLECWRWLPRDLGERHVRINIADFRLGAYERDKEVFNMRVVVGRKEDSTPVFSDSITMVQLNPSWNVPASIATEELLPEIRKDPEYLSKHEMELLADWSESAPVILPDTIDWESLPDSAFKFRVRQKNGEASALGKIKFQLSNPFNIYLHDTPAKKYFDRDKRALSHGCVRLAEPMKLALWVLDGGSARWDRRTLDAEIAKGKETYLPVPRPAVRVHILYLTCFADSRGGLQFRQDVYRWDRKIASAIDRKAASF